VNATARSGCAAPFLYRLKLMATSKNPLRVALAVCDARCTPVQLRFSTTIAAARNGF